MENVLRRLDKSDTVLRTDLNGNIVVISDGSNLEYTCQKEMDTSESVSDKAQGTENKENIKKEAIVIGNKNSKKYHTPACRSLPLEKNRVYLESEEEAELQGYTPCGLCH